MGFSILTALVKGFASTTTTRGQRGQQLHICSFHRNGVSRMSVPFRSKATAIHSNTNNPIDVSDTTTSNSSSNKWHQILFETMVNPQIEYDPDDFRMKQKVELRPILSPFKPSPVELVTVRGRHVYMKRDDLLRLPNSNVSGNKARKMFALNQIPALEFPKCIVSYGGAQSNAMVALAAVVQSKNAELVVGDNDDRTEHGEDETLDDEHGRQQEEGPIPEKRFVYYSKKVPRFLRKNPSGNYFRGKALGMDMVEVSNDEYKQLFGGDTGGSPHAPRALQPPIPGDSVWIPQGGASGFAVPGCRLLAKEIFLFWAANGAGRPLSVFIPGGTCSTALILHRELMQIIQANSSELAAARMDIQVVVIPCVGDEGYAERQMMTLNMETGGRGEKEEIPVVLRPSPQATFYLEEEDTQRYFPFGEPNADILDTFREMEEYGVQIDLLYGAPAWNILLRHWPDEQATLSSSFLADREIMYVHSGGLDGINSQLMRYRHKGLVEGNEVQHPERQRRSSKEFLETRQTKEKGTTL